VVLDILENIRTYLMKKYIYFTFFVFTLLACKSTSKVVSTNTKISNRIVTLSENNQRKFNYFFFEGQRLKMQGDYNKSKMYFIECLKIDTLSSVCFYELANIEIGYKNYKGAQELLENAVRIKPDNKWYNVLLGDLYQQNKNLEGSIKIYKNLRNSYPTNDEYMYILAQLYTQNKDFELAVDEYNSLEKSIGLNEVISLEKEKIFLQMGKDNLAIKEIEKLIKNNPYEVKYYGFLGDFYMFSNNLEKAEESYNKILSIDKTNGLGYFSLSNIYLQKGDSINYLNYFNKALNDNNLNFEVKIQRLMPIIINPKFGINNSNITVDTLFNSLLNTHKDDSRGYIYYANYLRSRGLNLKAFELFEKAISIDKNDESVWQDLFLLELDLGYFEKLQKDSEDAILIFPNQPVFYLFNGMSYLQKEDYLNAEKSLSKGLSLVEDNIKLKAQFTSYLGDIYYNLKDKKKAFENYDKSLEYDENNVVVLNNYSYYLSLEGKNLDKAEKMIAKCIELEPGNSTYLDTYAWVLFKRGRFFESKFIIERAIDKGGSESDVIVEHYGDILYKNGDLNGALLQWKKSKEMGNKSDVLIKKIELKTYVEE